MRNRWYRKSDKHEVIDFLGKNGGKSPLEELANYLSIDVFEITRVLNELRDMGQLEYDQQNVWLKDYGTFQLKEFSAYFQG